MEAPFFLPKLGEDQKKWSSLQNKWVFGPEVCENLKKKGLRLKISGFLLQMRMGTTKQSEKVRYLPQIGGVMISHHNMVSPQNGDTGAGRPP